MSSEPIDCLICAHPIKLFCVFGCGHYCCHTCGLRIHNFTKKGCPVCRTMQKNVYVLRGAPRDTEAYDVSTLDKSKMFEDKFLKIHAEDCGVLADLDKLTGNYCPIGKCWVDGRQEPFYELRHLEHHLSVDHSLFFCDICLMKKPAFVGEQIVYSRTELEQHKAMKKHCKRDPESFQGHPRCEFCNTQYYDGEVLLAHMQQAHYTCDLCNRQEFTFTYYNNRAALSNHFSSRHRVCNHPDCASQDIMCRVFATEVELSSHQARAHGSGRGGMSLDTLGFNFSYNSRNNSGNSSGGGARGGRGTNNGPAPAPAPAPYSPPSASDGAVHTGANTHASLITFDYITRQVQVDVTPTGNKGASGANSKRPKSPQPAPAASAPTTAAPEPKLTQKEHNKALKEKLVQRLSPEQFAKFRELSTDFLGGKLLATEYYGVLFSYLHHDGIDDVFAHLVGSIPDAARRDSLMAARRTMASSEAKKLLEVKAQQEKLRAEQEAKEKARAERDAKVHALKVGGKTHHQHSKNPWHKSSPPPPEPAKVPPRAVHAPAAPAAVTGFVDPMAFPSLTNAPETPVAPTGGWAKRAPVVNRGKKGNVWFTRANH